MKKLNKINPNYLIITFAFLVIIFSLINIIFTNLKFAEIFTEISDLKNDLQRNSEKIAEFQEQMNLFASETNENFSLNRNMADKQYNKTIQIERTYSQLLDEEKKERIDNSEFDQMLEKTKQEAKKYFINQQYSFALTSYKKVLEINPADNESRLYKMLSLFSVNKMDSTNYKEILEDIKVLKENGITDERVETVESYIKQELY